MSAAETSLLAQYGLALVFANVLVEQVGVPIPAVPTLVMSGALAAEGRVSLAALVAVATLACMIGDGLWYVAGRRYGLGVLKFLCKVSLSPDSCVRQTESRFGRWGGVTLVFGKFIPGISTVAPPLAGAMKIGWMEFLVLNTLGILLWVAVAVGLGWIFHASLAGLIDRFEALGTVAVQVIVALLATFIGFKWWERRRLFKSLRLARISVRELRGLMDAGAKPVVVDVRNESARAIEGRAIPGAIAIDLADVTRRHGELPIDRDIVFYCTCPNEASAAEAAKRLMDLGYTRVRPLAGGLEEWIAAGYEVQSLS